MASKAKRNKNRKGEMAIPKAWQARDDKAARTLTCDVPGLVAGNPFKEVQQTHSSLQAWQRDSMGQRFPYYFTAVPYLLANM